MPRKPKFMHPVRVVRNAIGDSQSQFAAKVGCSAVTIEKVENGKLGLSSSLAYRIRLYTGAWNIANKKGKPTDENNRPYTRETFVAWQRSFARVDEKNAKDICQQMEYALSLVVESAARSFADKLPMVYASFRDWLQRTAAEFNLEKGINAILAERTFPDSKTMTYGEWRKLPEWSAYYGFKDNRSKKDSEELKLTVKARREWFPGSDMRPTP